MADKAFDREVINQYERPLSQDINRAQSQLDRSLRDVLRYLFSSAGGTINSGFVQNSFRVTEAAVPDMSVLVAPGFGFEDRASDVPSAVGGIVGVDDLSPYKPLVLTASQSVAVDPAPSAGNERRDIIEVQVVDRRLENPSSRDVFNPGTGVFAANLVNKTLAFYLDGQTGRVVTPNPSVTGIGYKVGTAAPTGTSSPPPVTAGYVKIAEILVSGEVTMIVDADIADSRTFVNPTPGPLSVGTAQLVDLAVTTAKIDNLAVTAAKIANLAVTAAKIANQTITAAQIANQAITDAQIASNAVTTAKIANLNVTRAKLEAVGQQISLDCGYFSSTSTALVDVTNLSVTLTTGGRPVMLMLRPADSGTLGLIGATSGAVMPFFGYWALVRNTSELGRFELSLPAANETIKIPCSTIVFLDTPSAGTYTYKLQAACFNQAGGGYSVAVERSKLVAFEL